MKKNLRKVIVLLAALLVMSASLEVFATAVPKKTEGGSTEQKYSSDTRKVIETVTSNSEKSGSDEEVSATSSKDEEQSQASVSKKEEESKVESTAKPSSTSKSKTTSTQTAKPTQKATSTQKTTSETKSTSKTTVSTVKPTIEDAEDDQQGNSVADEENNVIDITEEAPEPTLNVMNNSEQINGKRYLTKGGAFGMFILTVLVSAVLSFLISYRFYKMNRTDSHVMAEIRALKRDIDTKMSGTVGGFSEYETKTTNSNPGYMRNERPIRRTTVHENNENAQSDMYSKWERQINTTPKTQEEENSAARRREYYESHRSSHARTQKTTSSKIKNVFDDFFSKKK